MVKLIDINASLTLVCVKQTFKIVLQIGQVVEDPKCVASESLHICVSEALKKS